MSLSTLRRPQDGIRGGKVCLKMSERNKGEGEGARLVKKSLRQPFRPRPVKGHKERRRIEWEEHKIPYPFCKGHIKDGGSPQANAAHWKIPH